MHHIYAPERLRAAYHALHRNAAAGVDGQTWQSYGQMLEANLQALSDRLARGGYRPEPVRRVYIDKADGTKRPLGVPALEDKLVQRATVDVQFGLKLHPEKTRLIEFGRFARDDRRRKGQGKPHTFDFLGFTHCCGKTRQGKFMVLRLTSAKRLRAKLQAVKQELGRRMHRPVAAQGQYLQAVVTGHGRYFGVPCNGTRLSAFRLQVARLWHRMLCCRSQRHHLPWRRMSGLIARWLPYLHICHPYPQQRLIVTTQGRSRMR